MKKVKEVKIHIGPGINDQAKNLNGVKGEKCDGCGGYGFTMSIKGGKLPCQLCDGTGVKLPTVRELQGQISDLRQDLHLLKKALLETLQTHGLSINTNVQEANHV